MDDESLFVSFRGTSVPVTYNPSTVSKQRAERAIRSNQFQTWLQRCSTSASQTHNGQKQHLVVEAIELQGVDVFGKDERVGLIKLSSVVKLRSSNDEDNNNNVETSTSSSLPGICFLRGNAVCILVALIVCPTQDDDNDNNNCVFSLLVDQPRVPIGQVSALELPAGMLDGGGGVAGIACQEMKEECGIDVRESDLVDLTMLACQDAAVDGQVGHDMPFATGIAPSPGGCDEFIRCMYLEKTVTPTQLEEMRGRLLGLRNHGELITLQVVPFDDVWKVSADAKAMCSLFLLDKLREQGKVPPMGELATPLAVEPTLTTSNGKGIPQLAFGLYKVPASDEGERIILDAIHAGYRHFDTAAFYQNEATLGRALKRSGLPREHFFIVSKVWNDSQKNGRAAVRESVEESLEALDFGGYFDLYLVHWPVPKHFVDTYKELEILHDEGKLHELGISNFSPKEYEELADSGIHVTPVVNQIEVSPVLYRKDAIDYFASKGILISSFKPLNRAKCFDRPPIPELAAKYSKTPAQIMLRWGLQKGLIVVSKTNSRMKENRDVVDFSLTDDEMLQLDALTTQESIREREQHELMSKTEL